MEQMPKKKRKIKDFLIYLPAFISVLVLIGVLFFIPDIITPNGELTTPTDLSDPIEETTLPEETEEPSLLPANPYGKNDFQYYGEFLQCLTGPSMTGIDVSRYQGDIDWQTVRDVGVEFAIIRVGGRSYSSDAEIYTDANAQRNYEGARAAGIKVGVYFFAQAINVAEAREEAEFVLRQIADWELDMPVVYDWEYVNSQARTANVDAAVITACTRTFCETVEASGYKAMVYFNPAHAASRVYLEQLTDFDFWLSMYTDRMTYPYKINMWQYTSEGSIPGISGPVDINLYFPYDEA